jgi:hypothetical protein
MIKAEESEQPQKIDKVNPVKLVDIQTEEHQLAKQIENMKADCIEPCRVGSDDLEARVND